MIIDSHFEMEIVFRKNNKTKGHFSQKGKLCSNRLH